MTTKSHQQVMVEIDEIHHILPDRRLDQLLVYKTTQQLFRIRGYVRNDSSKGKQMDPYHISNSNRCLSW
jgi:hypothetical protein